MDTKAFVVCASFLLIFKISWACDEQPIQGCNPPSKLAPVNLTQLRGVWYVQAAINPGSNPQRISSTSCIRHQYFVKESGRRGLFIIAYMNSNGFYGADPYFINFIRPGRATFNSPGSNATNPEFYRFFDGDSFIVHRCAVVNGITSFEVNTYFSRRRSVPRQTVLDAFNATGVLTKEPTFVPQENCKI